MSPSPHIADVTQQTFESLVLAKSREIPVLADFWAAWCGPCKQLMPVLAKLADEYGGKFFLAKINSDTEQPLAARYGVKSLPTVKLFRNGQVVEEFMGAQPEKTIRALLDRHIPRESDTLVYNAMLAARSGKTRRGADHPATGCQNRSRQRPCEAGTRAPACLSRTCRRGRDHARLIIR